MQPHLDFRHERTQRCGTRPGGQRIVQGAAEQARGLGRPHSGRHQPAQQKSVARDHRELQPIGTEDCAEPGREPLCLAGVETQDPIRRQMDRREARLQVQGRRDPGARALYAGIAACAADGGCQRPTHHGREVQHRQVFPTQAARQPGAPAAAQRSDRREPQAAQQRRRGAHRVTGSKIWKHEHEFTHIAYFTGS